MFLYIYGVQCVMPGSIKLALCCWCKQIFSNSSRQLWNAVPNCIFWTTCLERNNRWFDDKRDNISIVKARCLKSLYLWSKESIVSDRLIVRSSSVLQSIEGCSPFNCNLSVPSWCYFYLFILKKVILLLIVPNNSRKGVIWRHLRLIPKADFPIDYQQLMR